MIIFLTILFFILLIIGILGIFLPILPGVPIAWLGLLIFAFGTSFNKVSVTSVSIFLLLTLLSVALDFLGPIIIAKGYKTSTLGILGLFIGAILGIIFGGPMGIIFGPFIGAFFGEFFSTRDTKMAMKSAIASVVGFVATALIKLAIIISMAVYFFFAILS